MQFSANDATTTSTVTTTTSRHHPSSLSSSGDSSSAPTSFLIQNPFQLNIITRKGCISCVSVVRTASRIHSSFAASSPPNKCDVEQTTDFSLSSPSMHLYSAAAASNVTAASSASLLLLNFGKLFRRRHPSIAGKCIEIVCIFECTSTGRKRRTDRDNVRWKKQKQQQNCNASELLYAKKISIEMRQMMMKIRR